MHFSKAAFGFCLLLSSSFQEPTTSAPTASPTRESKVIDCDGGTVPVNANGTTMDPDSWLYANGHDIPTLSLCNISQELQPPISLLPDSITIHEDGRREIKYTLFYRVAKYIGPAFTTFLKLFNGVGPAPTIRIRPGDNVIIDLVNELENITGNTVLNQYRDPNTTNLHLHGAHIIGQNPGDNVAKIVPPGTNNTYNYTFDYDHMPGTLWYHPHWHGATSHQTGQGAAGLLIIEDPNDYQIPNYLKKMTETAEIEMVLTHLNLVNDANRFKDDMTAAAEESGSLLTNWTINGTNIDITNFTASPEKTNMILVNMQYIPQVTMEAGKWYRWRILLASVEERLAMALGEGNEGQGCEVQLLAKDGIYLTDAPRPVSDIILNPGNRADVAVRCKGPGKVPVINKGNYYDGILFNTQPQIMLLNIVLVTGRMEPDLTKFVVPRPCYLVDLKHATASELNPPLPVNFTFSPYSINNQQFVNQQKPLTGAIFKLGTVQEIVMGTAPGHPYHQHINPFQIMKMENYQSANATFKNWYQIGDWHDVLQTINIVSTATVRFAVNTFTGPMVVHCHILFHEDRGMIGSYNLTAGDGGITTWPGAKRADPNCIPHNFRPSGRLATTFDGQDFSIGNMVTEFQNVDNAFSLQLNYTVGGSVSKLGMTLFYENCTTPYVDRNQETMVIEIGRPMSADISVKKINIFKENFSVSPLVTKQKGNSVGVLDFCVKVEGLMDNDLSVTFKKDNIKLSYDLSKNVFAVNGNNIRENNVTLSSTKVTTSYGVDACRCNGINFDLRCEDTSSIKQDTLLYICIKPTKSSANSTNISDLTMRFEQDNEVKFTAVEYGFKINRLSQITKSGQTFQVVSRLVTALFEGTADSFNVTGNAYLSFKTETRRLATMHTSDLRLVEETTQEDIAGEATFKMDVKLEKETVLATAVTKDRTRIAVSVLGGFIFLSAIFVLVKRTRRQES